MVAPLLMLGLLSLVTAMTATAPRRLHRQVEVLDQYRLDQALRSSRRSWSSLILVYLGAICVVQTGTTLARGVPTWPVWLLACAAAAAALAMDRRNRPHVQQVLESAGARGSDEKQLEHDRRTGRWVLGGAGLYTFGSCLRVMSQIDQLSWLDVVGGTVTAVSLLVFLVAGWKLLRGPDPEPIVLWYRDR